MKNNQKLFAFKLTEKEKVNSRTTQWKAREGVAIAGCTLDRLDPGEYRWPHAGGASDAGAYC